MSIACRSRFGSWVLLSCLASAGASGCGGDDDGPVDVADADGESADLDVVADDGRDGEADTEPESDAGDGTPDGAEDEAGAETDGDDGAAETVESACGPVTPLALESGVEVTVEGDTTLGVDRFTTTEFFGCGPAETYPAPQVYFVVDLSAGWSYRIRAETTFTGILELFRESSCPDPAAIADDVCRSVICGAWAHADASGATAELLFVPEASDRYIVGLDSYAETGPFVLHVLGFDPAAPDACSTAIPFTTPGFDGVSYFGVASGTTAGGGNAFPGEIACGGATAFDGPDVFYSWGADPSSSATCGLTADFDAEWYFFRREFCGSAAGINTECAAAHVHVPAGGSGEFGFPSAGEWIIAIDSVAGPGGAYSLNCSYQHCFDCP
jgi:hypothetical protein